MEVPMKFQKKLPQECPQKDCGGIAKEITERYSKDNFRGISEAIAEGFLKGIVERIPKTIPRKGLNKKTSKILALEMLKVIVY